MPGPLKGVGQHTKKHHPVSGGVFLFKSLSLAIRKGLLVLTILSFYFGCSETHRIRKMTDALGKCENNWQYFKLTQPIKGIVLSHTKGYCGYAHIHANTIVITTSKDTIRVDGPCYTENTVASDSVVVNAYETDNVKGAIGDSKYDCTVMKTCHGLIKKIK